MVENGQRQLLREERHEEEEDPEDITPSLTPQYDATKTTSEHEDFVQTKIDADFEIKEQDRQLEELKTDTGPEEHQHHSTLATAPPIHPVITMTSNTDITMII